MQLLKKNYTKIDVIECYWMFTYPPLIFFASLPNNRKHVFPHIRIIPRSANILGLYNQFLYIYKLYYTQQNKNKSKNRNASHYTSIYMPKTFNIIKTAKYNKYISHRTVTTHIFLQNDNNEGRTQLGLPSYFVF